MRLSLRGCARGCPRLQRVTRSNCERGWVRTLELVAAPTAMDVLRLVNFKRAKLYLRQ